MCVTMLHAPQTFKSANWLEILHLPYLHTLQTVTHILIYSYVDHMIVYTNIDVVLIGTTDDVLVSNC